MKTAASLAFLLIVALIMALTSATKALADDDEETPEQLQVIEEGGCAVISRRELMAFRNHMMEEGRKRGLEEGARLCRKGTT